MREAALHPSQRSDTRGNVPLRVEHGPLCPDKGFALFDGQAVMDKPPSANLRRSFRQPRQTLS